MKRANPAQLRQSLEVANTMVKHGIRFVCMPVVDEADVIMKKLRNSFETAAADDKSAPLMDNAQKVYAGMTYGRGRLTESFINDDNRGFLA